jgi:hypothetical protein
MVSWFENEQIVVKSWNGSSWQQLGETLEHPSASRAMSPSIDLNNGKVAVAWFEEDHGQAVSGLCEKLEWFELATTGRYHQCP